VLLMRLPCAELETEKLCCCLGSPVQGRLPVQLRSKHRYCRAPSSAALPCCDYDRPMALINFGHRRLTHSQAHVPARISLCRLGG